MNQNSPHILNTSSNLLGFSFLVLVSIKGLGLPQAGIVDELVAILVVAFAMSSVLSFVSMQLKSNRPSLTYEKYAGYAFFFGLVLTMMLSVLLAMDIILFIR